MPDSNRPELSDVLDRLERAVDGDAVSVQRVVDELGNQSFASLLLIFSLISASPASAVPGVTAMVALIDFILVVQMLAGRKSAWLPAFVRKRQIPRAALCKGIGWLRKPVRFVERFVRARLTFFVHRPWLYLPLLLTLALTLFMPFMEFVPTSGSVASVVIALFAAGLLTRDGGLVLLAFLVLLGLAALVWQAGFGPS